MDDLMADAEKNAHALAELERRLSFEFDGMRLHEYYFSQWEKGPAPIQESGALSSALVRQFGSFESFIKLFTNVGLMRGVGWAILYFDEKAGLFHVGFSEQQHQGHFVTLPIVLALDMWEHAFVAQFGVGGKKAYIEAFMKNLNWDVMESRFAEMTRA